MQGEARLRGLERNNYSKTITVARQLLSLRRPGATRRPAPLRRSRPPCGWPVRCVGMPRWRGWLSRPARCRC